MTSEQDQREDFSSRYRVYYEDTDAGGVVYHSNYLNFMERCRCDWLAAIGYDVVTIEQDFCLQWVVKEADLVFHAPARLFDELTVSCHVLQVGKVSLMLEQAVYNDAKLLCSARIKLATLHNSSFKLSAMPEELINALQASKS